MLSKTLMMILLTLLIILSGCWGPTIVKHPDAPMLIEEVGNYESVSVAIYHKETNRMIHYGWVKIEPGYTLRDYDWDKYISNH